MKTIYGVIGDTKSYRFTTKTEAERWARVLFPQASEYQCCAVVHSWPLFDSNEEVMNFPNEELMYKLLIAKVARIDSSAARYLQHEARQLKTFIPSLRLAEVFAWDDTPQGFDYWRALSDELGE